MGINKEVQIIVWVTTKCNMKCSYCYEKDKPFRDLNDNILFNIHNFISAHMHKVGSTKCTIRFHGGEPLLNWKAVETVIELTENIGFDIKYELTTNGLLLDNILEKDSLKKINNIWVSIDGTIGTLQRTRGLKNIDASKLINNCIKILKIREDITARITLKKEEIKNLKENILFLIDIGFRNIIPVFDVLEKNWDNQSLRQYNEQIEYIQRIIDKNIKIFGLKDNFIHKKGLCNGGIYNLNIYVDGNIYPCLITAGKKDFICGNVYNGVNYNWIRKLDQINNVELLECKECTYKDFCINTRCKFYNKVVMGCYSKPNPGLCAIENFRYYNYYNNKIFSNR